MSVAVPVIPYRANVLYDEDKFYELLLTCQTKLGGQHQTTLISVSQIINCVDPLVILSSLTEGKQGESFSQTNPLYFYWENRGKETVILGYGSTKSFFINSANRFIFAQQFVKDCFQEIVIIGDSDKVESLPHLLGGFTFFSQEKERESGFPDALVFLPQLQIVKSSTSCVLTINFLLETNTNLRKISQEIRYKTQEILSINHHNSLKKHTFIHPKPQFKMEMNFKNAVASALKSIEANQFKKLVLAHTLDIISNHNFSFIDCLNNLRYSHPDCYVFALHNGQGNCFVGASPERLISVKNQQLVTDALAGSAPRGKTAIEDANLAQKLLKSEKERREHQVVIDVIVQRLIKMGLTPQISPLKVLQLSNIQHLWTPIYTQLKPNINPLEVVANLHPTPAVSGFPTEITCQEIGRYETFERGLYAAPLGWIDYQGNSEFIVGIRSALISGNKARLYAGAGIVKGSEPEKELAEIKLKFQALLKALSQTSEE